MKVPLIPEEDDTNRMSAKIADTAAIKTITVITSREFMLHFPQYTDYLPVYKIPEHS
jgi:hypothetical protein